jgi:23S rRNA (uracil1939-C5)-methyltransferase
VEVEVRDMAVGGEAVAIGPEGVVLVAGAAPGERIRISGLRRSGGVARARLEEVIRPSEVRIEPICPLAGRCGGCPWMHLEVQARRALKKEFVADALKRSGHLADVRFHAAPQEVGWRRRARLSWADGILGYRGRRSRRPVDVPSCAVLTAPLEAALRLLRTTLLGELRGSGEISLAEADGQASIVVRPESPAGAAAYSACESMAAAPGVAGVALMDPDSPAPATWGAPVDTTPAPDGLPLQAAAGGFSQANAAVNSALVQVVRDVAETDDASVLELYAGAGNLTVALAPRARKYVAVEENADATEACRGNLRARDIQGVRVVATDASTPPKGRFDVVVLDPPRTGARDALPGILKARPKRIVYVSCDPKTLERDLRILGPEDWCVTAAHGFDMFPQTAHVEAVVKLERVR